MLESLGPSPWVTSIVYPFEDRTGACCGSMPGWYLVAVGLVSPSLPCAVCTCCTCMPAMQALLDACYAGFVGGKQCYTR
jgi:hypothetical protein